MKVAILAAFLPLVLAAQTTPRINSVQALGSVTTSRFAPGQYVRLNGPGVANSPSVKLNGVTCRIISMSAALGSVFFQVPTSFPLGAAEVTLDTAAGPANPVNVTIAANAPVIVLNTGIPPISYFFQLNPAFTAVPTPSPGNRVFVYLDGAGTAQPPDSLQFRVDNLAVPIIAPAVPQALVGFELAPLPAYLIEIPNVPGGPHTLTATAAGVDSLSVAFTVIARGLVLSQTGLTFNAVAGGPRPAAQTFGVLSGLGPLDYTLTASTISGGAWLTASPTSGTVLAQGSPGLIQVTANPGGLAAGTYYGKISVSARDVPNSPQTVTVVLSVADAATRVSPTLDRTGIIFVGPTGGQAPQPQTVRVTNPGLANLTATAAIQGTPALRFPVTPATVPLPSGQTVAFEVTPNTLDLPTGIYTVRLALSFSDGSSRLVSLLLVVAPGATASGRSADSLCTPTRLIPVFSLLGDGFAIPAAWPASIEATIVDDCGSPMNRGVVGARFSNGDPPLRLEPNLGGKWSATWPPTNPRTAGIVITVVADLSEGGITGSATITGGVSANPAVPEIAPGGIVETASYRAPAAPGNLVAIFGVKLAPEVAQATSVPLPEQLASVSVFVGARSMPLYFTSDGQLVGVLPYDVPINTRQQILVQRGTTISVPQALEVGIARPAVFTVDGTGAGQGHVYKIDAQGRQILANAQNPAKAGDVLVIYCSGLGAVAPALKAGDPTPLEFLTQTVETLTVTIGGRPAQVLFSGLTPGSTALYQANVVVPTGVTNSDLAQVVLTIAGQDSVSVAMSVRN
jgi:uncharacterized protein (TIGR03437 family)